MNETEMRMLRWIIGVTWAEIKKKKIRGGLGVASMGKMRDNWLTCYDD